MNDENKRRVQESVAQVGKELEGKLPTIEGLLKRNSYAHIWKSIKDRFGMSYKNLDDAYVDAVLEHVEKCISDGTP